MSLWLFQQTPIKTVAIDGAKREDENSTQLNATSGLIIGRNYLVK